MELSQSTQLALTKEQKQMLTQEEREHDFSLFFDPELEQRAEESARYQRKQQLEQTKYNQTKLHEH